jgi:gentisate 1,2-dioxygenase
MATQAQDAFHKAMAEANCSPLWERYDATHNKPPPSGHIWRWSVMEPLIQQAIAATSMESAERRVLTLDNPHLPPGKDGAALNLSVNLQVLMPGEKARPHRHCMNALRFALEGDEVYTIVNGKPFLMQRGDLLLTPGMCWHSHDHKGKKRAVWVDALDVPLFGYLDLRFFEPGPPHDVPEQMPDDAFLKAGMVPAGLSDPGYSPIFRYPYEVARTALATMPEAADGSRLLRYTNPMSGGSCMTSLDCYLMSVKKGRETTARRTSSNMCAVVVEGEGFATISDEKIPFKPNDVISCPSNAWTSFTATSGDAIIFEITDRDILDRLGLLKDEYRS